MQPDIQSFFLPSVDGEHRLACYYILPQGEIRGIFQICHGMSEYFLNYGNLIDAMTEKGFVVAGHDHLGHGRTAKEGEHGHIPDEKGAFYLAEDTFSVTRELKRRFPGKKLILFGHSMGSFITRYGMTLYPGVSDLIILSGTGGTNPLLPLAKRIAKTGIRMGKGKEPAKTLDAVAFGNFNNRFKRKDPSKKAWITGNPQLRKSYETNPKIGFLFTWSGFYVLFELMRLVTSAKWPQTVCKETPVLLVAGRQDPVGNYGKGVSQTYHRLKKAGLKDLELIFYESCRHEPHNDLEMKQEQEDLENWISKRL